MARYQASSTPRRPTVRWRYSLTHSLTHSLNQSINQSINYSLTIRLKILSPPLPLCASTVSDPIRLPIKYLTPNISRQHPASCYYAEHVTGLKPTAIGVREPRTYPVVNATRHLTTDPSRRSRHIRQSDRYGRWSPRCRRGVVMPRWTITLTGGNPEDDK